MQRNPKSPPCRVKETDTGLERCPLLADGKKPDIKSWRLIPIHRHLLPVDTSQERFQGMNFPMKNPRARADCGHVNSEDAGLENMQPILQKGWRGLMSICKKITMVLRRIFRVREIRSNAWRWGMCDSIAFLFFSLLVLFFCSWYYEAKRDRE